MLPELLQRISLFQVLHRIDLDLAASHRQIGCPHCGGPLHQANYLRKPRGGNPQIPEQFCVRQSLCCGREGCRHRSPPPSCLFMGRRVYWGCVVLVVTALRQRRPNGISAGRLSRMFSIPRKTLMRWFDYFRDQFQSGAQWQRIRGRLGPRVIDSELPASLLDYFIEQSADDLSGLVGCLRLLAT